VFVATRFLSDDRLELLRGFPEIGAEDLARFFTLTDQDVAFTCPGRGRGPTLLPSALAHAGGVERRTTDHHRSLEPSS
jgi:hypothetical protein